MVKSVTSLTGSGLKDWLIQRGTAVVLAAYVFTLVFFLYCHSPINYTDWHTLFAKTSMRVFSFIALLALGLHTWIGMWTITTDYLKCSCLRLSVQIVVRLTLLGCFAWGLLILWGR